MLTDVSLHCIVTRQLLSRIYTHSSVKFPCLKLGLCKKDDKYQVWSVVFACFSVSAGNTEQKGPQLLICPFLMRTTLTLKINKKEETLGGMFLKVHHIHARRNQFAIKSACMGYLYYSMENICSAEVFDMLVPYKGSHP